MDKKTDEDMFCPSCHCKMLYYMDTPVCPFCDKIPIADLTWCKKHIEEKTKL